MAFFSGRSLSIINDLNVEEQWYLYQKTRELKEGLAAGKTMEDFRIKDEDFSMYLLFLEDSTRTKESFRNAAAFHGARVNVFDSTHSSFNKKESLTDTIKMLVGYAGRSLFIIRSKQEGTCTALSESISEYAHKQKLPTPAFINAGDGKHEHPTQELLDEFTFLEKKNWDRSIIRIALVGDLFHGRTVHSKADGLRIFDEVHVDLVAPPELAMPEYYVHRMKANGFKVRIFTSIEEYLEAKEIADIWYYTRLQLERMGEKVLDKAESLRKAVTFQKKYLSKIQDGTKFYHPLPRHREYPVVPTFLDHTELNGWDEQSMNGYFTRITEIAMFGGKIGDDFKGSETAKEVFNDDFIEELEIHSSSSENKKTDMKIGIRPVENGLVIDHIGKGNTISQIWSHIDKIRRILNLNTVASHGVYKSNRTGLYKGIISLPEINDFSDTDVKKLGAIAPECTVNIIRDSKIIRKVRVHMPPRIYNFDEISCRNENCISNPELHEPIVPYFFRSNQGSSGTTGEFICKYCEKPHQFQEIWSDK
jgi:aspartate carbamoyltransferase